MPRLLRHGDGRAYAGWVLDVMKASGIEAQDVEYVIAPGKSVAFEGMTRSAIE